MVRQRLVSLYTTEQDSTIEVILGAKSLDDMITRIDSAKSVTHLDARVLAEVTQFRHAVVQHKRKLRGGTSPGGAPRRGAGGGEAVDRVEDRRAASGCSRRSRARSPSCSAAEAARQLQMARAAQARIVAQHQASAAAGGRHDRRGLGRRRRSRTRSSRRRRRTAASSGSRCRSSARRTSGAARRPAGSTAPGS